VLTSDALDAAAAVATNHWASWADADPCSLMVLQALKAAGVTEVILAINYQPEVRY
jgi:hypothetical protein